MLHTDVQQSTKPYLQCISVSPARLWQNYVQFISFLRAKVSPVSCIKQVTLGGLSIDLEMHINTAVKLGQLLHVMCSYLGLKSGNKLNDCKVNDGLYKLLKTAQCSYKANCPCQTDQLDMSPVVILCDNMSSLLLWHGF